MRVYRGALGGRSITGLAAGIAIAFATVAASASAAPGDLDPSFGDRGISRPPALEYPPFSYLLALRPGGGSLIERVEPTHIGDYDEYDDYDDRLAAFDRSGDPVRSYGSDGTALLPDDFVPTDMSIAPGGSVTLSGYSIYDNESTFLQALRYTASGEPDPVFGSDGRVALSRSGFTGYAGGVLAGRHGGAFFSLDVNPGSRSAIAKVRADGELSSSFGEDGVTADVPGLSEFRLAFGPSQKLMVDVRDYFREPEKSFVYRYRGDGSLDAPYGTNGIATLKPQFRGEGGDDAFVVDDKGRSLIAQTHGYGDYRTEKLQTTLARLKRNGRLDPGFDASQAFKRNPNTGRAFRVRDMAVDRKGRIVLAGAKYEPGSPSEGQPIPSLARLLPNGSLDPRFGFGGFATFRPRDLGTNVFYDVQIQKNGKILTTGGGAIYRFLSSRGPADLDADGFVGDNDQCPSVPSEATKSAGCPSVSVELTGRYVRLDGLVGDIAAARRCLLARKPGGGMRGAAIRIMRVKPGRDELVSTVRVERQYAAWEWAGAKKHAGERFYAEYGPVVRPAIGRCERTRTPTIVVPDDVGG